MQDHMLVAFALMGVGLVLISVGAVMIAVATIAAYFLMRKQ